MSEKSSELSGAGWCKLEQVLVVLDGQVKPLHQYVENLSECSRLTPQSVLRIQCRLVYAM